MAILALYFGLAVASPLALRQECGGAWECQTFVDDVAECAKPCIAGAAKELGCSATDFECRCKNKDAIADIATACVLKPGVCSQDDLIKTITATNALCPCVDANGPPQAECPEPGTTTSAEEPATTSNRWLASYTFWLLSKRDLAVRSLLTPLPELILNAPIPDTKSRLFLFDDPALIIFYQQIREKTSSTLRGATKISPQQEFAFVLHTASLYDRMGCDLLALDLVANWKFLEMKDEERPLIEMSAERKRMRRRSSVTVDDGGGVRMETGLGGAKVGGLEKVEKRPVTTFQEPDMSWMF